MTDIRDALRAVWRSPALSCTVIMTLALGLAANTIVMTVVDGLALRVIPAFEAERLVRIYPLDARGRRQSIVPYEDYAVVRNASPYLHPLAGYIPDTVTARVGTTASIEPRELLVYYVSDNYFSTLGAAPAIGRTFAPADDERGAAPTAVVSHRLWQQLYERPDPKVSTQCRTT